MTVQLKVKRLRPEAILPTKAHATDAAWDIYIPDFDEESFKEIVTASHIAPLTSLFDLTGLTPIGWQIKTGISFGIPEGHYLQLETRSSMASQGIFVTGGVIDSGYTGEVVVVLLTTRASLQVHPGDRIAQAILHKLPDAELVEVDELPQTEGDQTVLGAQENDKRYAIDKQYTCGRARNVLTSYWDLVAQYKKVQSELKDFQSQKTEAGLTDTELTLLGTLTELYYGICLIKKTVAEKDID